MSFFKDTLKTRLYRNKARYPLLKLDALLDWPRLGDALRHSRDLWRGDRRGNSGYDPLKMFKAIVSGQWHSLSDPEREHALAVRADFLVFCDFDDLELPDHSTLCRYRLWLIKSGLLKPMLEQINHQLEQQGLKINQADVAVVDASVIESVGAPRRKALEVSDEGEVSDVPASKDKDATGVKKAGGFYPGYKLHGRSDKDGYPAALPVTAAHGHESQHLEPLLEDWAEGVEVLADKGYASAANREAIDRRRLKAGVMYKAGRNHPLSQEERPRNHDIKSKRRVIEQGFGTLKRRPGFRQASDFGINKVSGQSYLKAMCLNLLKASNKAGYA